MWGLILTAVVFHQKIRINIIILRYNDIIYMIMNLLI